MEREKVLMCVELRRLGVNRQFLVEGVYMGQVTVLVRVFGRRYRRRRGGGRGKGNERLKEREEKQGEWRKKEREGRGKEEGRKKKGEEVRGRRVKSSIVYTLG